MRLDDTPVLISQLDDAALRIGLGWHGVERSKRTLHGKKECCEALNKITSAVERRFCEELGRFERRALVEAAIANYEAAAVDRSRWRRTSGALIGMAEDEQDARCKIAEHHAKLNVVFVTSRHFDRGWLERMPVRGRAKRPPTLTYRG